MSEIGFCCQFAFEALMNLLLKSIFVHNVRDTLTGQATDVLDHCLPNFVTLSPTMKYLRFPVWSFCKNMYSTLQADFEKSYNIIKKVYVILWWV